MSSNRCSLCGAPSLELDFVGCRKRHGDVESSPGCYYGTPLEVRISFELDRLGIVGVKPWVDKSALDFKPYHSSVLYTYQAKLPDHSPLPHPPHFAYIPHRIRTSPPSFDYPFDATSFHKNVPSTDISSNCPQHMDSLSPISLESLG